MSASSPRAVWPPPRRMLLVPIWLALLAAALDVFVRYLRSRHSSVQHLSPDFPWMGPLALMTIATIVMLPVLLVSRLRSNRAIVNALFWGASTLAFADVLILIRGLAHPAVAVLAAGLAVQVTKLGLRAPGRVAVWGRRAVWPSVIVSGLVVAGVSWRTHAGTASPVPVVGRSSETRPPNVVLITLDTVRASHLSLYGYGRATSPQLTALASKGVTFEQAFATAPWTLPSHATMFTGRWPHELSADYDVALDGRFPTLAEFFGARGYATAGFVGNLRYCGRGSGLARGFGHFEDYRRTPGSVAASSTLLSTLLNNFRLRRLFENDQHLDRVSGASINDRAGAWLRSNTDAPFFLFLNYFDAHEPYLPPSPYDRRFGERANGRYSPLHHWLWNPAVGHRPLTAAEQQEEIDAYDGAVASLDAEIGTLFEILRQTSGEQNTIVLITADHGEEFAEHGVYEHGYSLYLAGVQVPLIVIAPGLAPAGQRVTAPVSLRDLAATIVDLATGAEGGDFPGTSLRRSWASETPALTSPIFSELSKPTGQPDWFPSSKGAMISILSNGMRYIRNGDGREELYDLVRDTAERTDLSQVAERQPVLVSLRGLASQVAAERR